MGFLKFLKNTKRVNSKYYLGTVRGYYTPKGWNGLNLENDTIVLWSNSKNDVCLNLNAITSFEKVSNIEGVDESGAELFQATIEGKKLLFRINSNFASTIEEIFTSRLK